MRIYTYVTLPSHALVTFIGAVSCMYTSDLCVKEGCQYINKSILDYVSYLCLANELLSLKLFWHDCSSHICGLSPE